LRTAHHDADVGGVVAGRVEVGVAADVRGKEHLDLGSREQGGVTQLGVIPQTWLVRMQQLVDDRPRPRPGKTAASHEII